MPMPNMFSVIVKDTGTGKERVIITVCLSVWHCTCAVFDLLVRLSMSFCLSVCSLLLLVCMSLTITGQPRNSIFSWRLGNCTMPSPASASMHNHLTAGKPSQCRTSHLPSTRLVGRHSEYQQKLRNNQTPRDALTRIHGLTVIAGVWLRAS